MAHTRPQILKLLFAISVAIHLAYQLLTRKTTTPMQEFRRLELVTLKAGHDKVPCSIQLHFSSAKVLWSDKYAKGLVM